MVLVGEVESPTSYRKDWQMDAMVDLGVEKQEVEEREDAYGIEERFAFVVTQRRKQQGRLQIDYHIEKMVYITCTRCYRLWRVSTEAFVAKAKKNDYFQCKCGKRGNAREMGHRFNKDIPGITRCNAKIARFENSQLNEDPRPDSRDGISAMRNEIWREENRKTMHITIMSIVADQQSEKQHAARMKAIRIYQDYLDCLGPNSERTLAAQEWMDKTSHWIKRVKVVRYDRNHGPALQEPKYSTEDNLLWACMWKLGVCKVKHESLEKVGISESPKYPGMVFVETTYKTDNAMKKHVIRGTIWKDFLDEKLTEERRGH